MATTKQTCRPLGSEEDGPTDNDDLQDRDPQKWWPNISTIVPSIATLIFGRHSIYLSLQANCACLENGPTAFDAGYSTEWGTKSPPIRHLSKLTSV
jgi:hypothetical protein